MYDGVMSWVVQYGMEVVDVGVILVLYGQICIDDVGLVEQYQYLVQQVWVEVVLQVVVWYVLFMLMVVYLWLVVVEMCMVFGYFVQCVFGQQCLQCEEVGIEMLVLEYGGDVVGVVCCGQYCFCFGYIQCKGFVDQYVFVGGQCGYCQWCVLFVWCGDYYCIYGWIVEYVLWCCMYVYVVECVQ